MALRRPTVELSVIIDVSARNASEAVRNAEGA